MWFFFIYVNVGLRYSMTLDVVYCPAEITCGVVITGAFEKRRGALYPGNTPIQLMDVSGQSDIRTHRINRFCFINIWVGLRYC